MRTFLSDEEMSDQKYIEFLEAALEVQLKSCSSLQTANKALESEIQKRDTEIKKLEEKVKVKESRIGVLRLNKIKCPECGDYLVSLYTHDFRECSCGKCSIDGGYDYLRRGYDPTVGYIECSEYLQGKDADH